jgi:hypothetical protein
MMGSKEMDVADKYACAELILSWGFYRDQGKWPELTATFAPDGEIAVSWFSGSFREFVDRCRQAFDAGQRSKHHIFPSVVRVAGVRRSPKPTSSSWCARRSTACSPT